MVDFAAWSRDRDPPVPGSLDHKGPLTVAFASELPKRPGDTSPHGPRLVVLGSASALYGANWQADELRAGAVFVESAIAWLAARPALLDIPNKPTFTAGLKVSEAWLASTFRYVVIYMPLACVLLGAAVYLRRRSTERHAEATAPKAPDEPPKAAPKKDRAKKKKSR